MSAGVNGPIFRKLGQKASHKDVQVVDVFRNGGDLVGVLSCTGNGKSLDKVDAQGIEKRIAAMTKDGKTSSMKTLKGLRVDPHADKLMGIVQADAKLGRMSKPVRMTPAAFLQQDNDSRCYSKAFTVEQGQLIFCFWPSFGSCHLCVHRSQRRWRDEIEGGIQLYRLRSQRGNGSNRET